MFNSEKNFERIVNKLDINTTLDPEYREELRRRMLATFETSGSLTANELQKGLQKSKFRMNHIVRIAATILVVVGIGAGILLLTQGNGMAGVAWADVQERIRNIKTVTYNATIRYEGAPDIVMRIMVRRPGLLRQEMIEPKKSTTIMDIPNGKILMLIEHLKQAVLIEMLEIPEEIRQEHEQLDMLVQLKEFIEESEIELGERKISGRRVKGYCVAKSKLVMTIWADAQTGVAVEMEVKRVFGETTMVMSDFQFDVELDEKLFSLEAPAGYELVKGQMNLKPASTEDLVGLLRMWVKRRGGTFPNTLTPSEFVKDCSNLEKSLSKEEKFEVISQAGRTFMLLALPEAKAHYVGKGVTLSDADREVFWYRPKGSQTYQVIYGDLSVREVAKEDLPR